ncbi:REP-associated tyrosine transposase [Symmachiella dynata]|uniref:REP-associated tyrosine transposase n=1 Tax=Symmachiella dynata TaxID=2527995 RepID=UPI0030EE7716
MERYRIRTDAAVYFVTYSIVDWLPVFVSEQACKIVTDSFSFCHGQKNLRINAYVIMPTHLHAIVFDKNFDSKSLEKTLFDFRKFTGRQLSDYCMQHAPPCFVATLKAAASKDRERRFWQSSRHPEAIETEAFWKQKLDYIHENPCRKGLVTRGADWRFSSARHFVSDGRENGDVEISALDWG